MPIVRGSSPRAWRRVGKAKMEMETEVVEENDEEEKKGGGNKEQL